MKNILIGGLFLGAMAVLAPRANAQDYPTRIVNVVVPAAPGGGLDRVARVIAEKLQTKWGQPVVVENKGGAAGVIGTDFVARAKPDGYTLLYAGTAQLVINSKSLYPNLTYDPEALVPISLVTTAPNVLVVNAEKVKATTVAELIALAKGNPDLLNYSSQGVGTTQQLSVEMIKSKAGINMQHVPYGGGAPALMGLLSGQVQVMFTEISGVLQDIHAGTLRALAVGSEKPNALLPGVPPISETLPGFISLTWQGVVAPPGTPPEIAAKISAAIAEALKQPDVTKLLSDSSVDAVGSTPADMVVFMKQERERWGDVIRLVGPISN